VQFFFDDQTLKIWCLKRCQPNDCAQKKKRQGPTPVIYASRGTARSGHNKIMRDYFSYIPIYLANLFRQWYRMHIVKIVETCEANSRSFTHWRNTQGWLRMISYWLPHTTPISIFAWTKILVLGVSVCLPRWWFVCLVRVSSSSQRKGHLEIDVTQWEVGPT
jgi:hypothetical protein